MRRPTPVDFVGSSDEERLKMLQFLGIEKITDLFSSVPSALLKNAPTGEGLSEWEGLEKIQALGKKNCFQEFSSFLGGGAYDHYVPALVDAVTSKSEFLTAYTPYQAEISQGMLQAIFEFQTAVSALTGMDVANASVYDGATATAESALMALRLRPEKKSIAILDSVHPAYVQVVRQYVEDALLIHTLDEIPEDAAAVIVQSPNFFGELVESSPHGDALLILVSNPLSYGIYKSAGELAADIAVGEMQPFGIPLQLGGPYAGYMACKREYVRQLPGRIVGKTTDSEGKEGYVLTLQAREQHIRRDKATSNICTNQALCALAALVSLLWYGKEGVPQLALTCFQRASYLRQKLAERKIPIVTKGAIFNEFTIKLTDEQVKKLYQKKILPGVSLELFFPERKGEWLVAVTEKKTKEALDAYVEAIS